MRYFTWPVVVAVCISAAIVHATEPQNSQQPSTSEKQQVSKQGTQNPEAYELYSNGRSYWAKRTRADLETAVSYFNQAVAKDPGYALAYAGLADAYAVLPDYGGSPSEDIPKSHAAAQKALELDATLARPHAALGYTKFRHEWDFAGGEAEFKKALALDPNDSITHAWYAENIGTIGGREQEALAEINIAHQLDPRSSVISFDLGNIHIAARRYDEAIAVCKKLADENPTFALAHYCLSEAYWAKRIYPQSIQEWKVESQLSGEPNDAELATATEQGFRSAGLMGALSKAIEVSLAQRKTGYSSAYSIAALYAQSGDKDQAFQWLNTAFQEHDQGLMGLNTDYTLDLIRSDPRLAELARKVGLPQASGQGTQNPEAYELYLKGRSYWAKRTRADLETAVSYFNQAVAKDPGYALAYAGLADAYAVLPDSGGSTTECIPKSNAAARKALELDPTLGRPHAVLGYNKMLYEWDFAGGEAEFKKALALDPDDAITHAWYGLSLGEMGGREQEAVGQVTRAYQLDPQTPVILEMLGLVHGCARQYDEAIAAYKKLADEHPTFAAKAHGHLGTAYWGKQMYPEVLEEWKTYDRLSGSRSGPELHSAMEQGLRSGGWKSALTNGIEIIRARCKTQPASACGYAFWLAYMYADLGDKEQAFQWLNAAFQQHDYELGSLKSDFRFDSIRSDPRFAELVRKVGLPQ